MVGRELGLRIAHRSVYMGSLVHRVRDWAARLGQLPVSGTDSYLLVNRA